MRLKIKYPSDKNGMLWIKETQITYIDLFLVSLWGNVVIMRTYFKEGSILKGIEFNIREPEETPKRLFEKQFFGRLEF